MWNIYLIFALVLIRRNECVTWDEAKQDYILLVVSYSDTNHDGQITNIVPVANQNQAITVYISLDIFSVTSFDAVAGRLDIYGSVKLRWQDDIQRSAKRFSGNVDSLMIDYSKIWTPTLILLNSADSVSAVGDSAYKVRFFTANQTVVWEPRVIMAGACSPDVSFFPFDQQECDFIFTPWSTDQSEIVFSLMSNEWGMSNFDPSSVWELVQTSSSLVTVSNRSAVKFTIVIKRYPLYFAFNIVLPILLLACLSGFLFLLPVDSGERVGFGITCFLSFAILLQTIMGFLPQSSSPLSLLCYYVIVMVLFSGLQSIVNILILRVYLKPKGTTVPRFLVHFIELINCTKFKRCYRYCKRNKVSNSEMRDSEMKIEEIVEADMDVVDKLSDKLKDEEIGEADMEAVENLSDKHKDKTTDKMEKFSDKHKDEMTGVVENRSDIQKDKTTVKHGIRSETGSSNDDFDEVDWYSVGNLLDFFFLLAFLGVQGAFSVFFLIPLGVRYS